MKSEEKIQINGREFLANRLLPEDSLLLHSRLMMCFGGILNEDILSTFDFEDIKSLANDKEKQIEMAENIMGFIGGWSASIDPIAIRSIIRDVVESCKILEEGKARSIILNNDFDGKVMDSYILFARVIFFELSGFFSGSIQKVGRT